MNFDDHTFSDVFIKFSKCFFIYFYSFVFHFPSIHVQDLLDQAQMLGGGGLGVGGGHP